jgi:type I restriction enzyme S subunit
VKKYSEYTPTGIAWNENMPSHWTSDKAKHIFSNPKQINKGNSEKNILSLTLKGVIRNDADNPIGLAPSDYSTYQIFEENELVFKLIDLENISTSRVGIVHERGIMSSAYIRLHPRIPLNLKYSITNTTTGIREIFLMALVPEYVKLYQQQICLTITLLFRL